MRPALRIRADRNGGVFTRRDAIASEYSERELKTLTGHAGAWVVVRRGVYAERELWESLGPDGRYLLTARAVTISAVSGGVLSHTSAAVAHGLPIRPHWRDLQHLTRPGVNGGRTENGVKHHTAGLATTDVTTAAGLSATTLARTAVDVGREHGFEDGVVACDAARRLGATYAALQAVVAGMENWPNVTAARAAVLVSDPGAQTIGETLTRLLLLELDIGVPETQFEVREGGRRADVDLRVGRHLFEFDGKVKYLGRDRGGVDDPRPAEEIVWDEKRREDWLRGLGYGMSRVTWAELFPPLRRRTKARLLHEYLATERRYRRAG